jgi:hypothetical protein
VIAKSDFTSMILKVCGESEGARTLCPTDAAKAIAAAEGGDDLAWRARLQDVRRTAITLAKAGQLVIYRKGKPADPENFRGVYRIGLPRSD